jgi:hypothetical protein
MYVFFLTHLCLFCDQFATTFDKSIWLLINNIIISRLVHAITPLEENKSFLEKVEGETYTSNHLMFVFLQVEFGEKLCGIAEDESFILDR